MVACSGAGGPAVALCSAGSLLTWPDSPWCRGRGRWPCRSPCWRARSRWPPARRRAAWRRVVHPSPPPPPSPWPCPGRGPRCPAPSAGWWPPPSAWTPSYSRSPGAGHRGRDRKSGTYRKETHRKALHREAGTGSRGCTGRGGQEVRDAKEVKGHTGSVSLHRKWGTHRKATHREGGTGSQGKNIL